MIRPATALFSRRSAVMLGAGVALAGPALAASPPDDGPGLPVEQMNNILRAKGNKQKQVVGYSFARTDLRATLPNGVTVAPEALLAGDVYFQPVGGGSCIVNADFCLAPGETDKFIDALLANKLTLQAFHQHLADISPMAWFIHFRGQDEPLKLATAVANAIKVTATPLPQPPSPPDQAPPFDRHKLLQILGGAGQAHGHGVLEIDVKRAERFTLNGRKISPDLNIATNIYFQRLDEAGHQALVIPDFGMLAQEVDPVMRKMRGQGWHAGCLYNQETAEQPQLYWAHFWKIGMAGQLAQEIRNGLDLCNMDYSA